MATDVNPADDEGKKVWNWADFLVNHPPNHSDPVAVTELLIYTSQLGHLLTPDLELHCDSERCQGKRQYFKSDDIGHDATFSWEQRILRYTCRNCALPRTKTDFKNMISRLEFEAFECECHRPTVEVHHCLSNILPRNAVRFPQLHRKIIDADCMKIHGIKYSREIATPAVVP